MFSREIQNLIPQYSFLEVIHTGVSSEIYRVYAPTENEYALKVFRKKADIEQFETELKNCKLLCNSENPDFIRYISSSEDDGISTVKYIVFEFAEKRSLDNFISQEIPLGEKNAKFMSYKIVEMAGRLHKLCFSHRDLNVHNIFLNQNYDLKIGSFGSAKYFLNQNGESVLLYDKAGTLEYMAPEVRNKFPYDGEKVDIYSLGVILLYLRTGKLLSEKGKDLSTDITQESFWKKIELEKDNLPQNFKDLVTSMLDKNYQNRPDIDTILNNSYFDEIRSPNNFQEGYNAFRDKLREIDNYNKVEF